ncbi:hypothetical protein CK203_047130 [Vitis vinifera]|uniref:Uncharacterized protein n=1 Tax=Vitis vinifera TaxID=29760 RepID=A0A438GSS8_VITVI|nr:hypothetical protein CK203_047130 [Vitis vinifera]
MAGNELVIQMEEGQQEVVADKVVKPADGNKHFRTLADLKSEILQLGNKETYSSATKKRRCPKVPEWLLPSDAKGSKPSDKCLSPSDAKGSVLSDNHHYMPKIMSFGPYHHGNPKLERGETIKLKLAADGIQLLVAGMKDQPIEEAVDHVYSIISGKVEELMGSYDMKSIEKYSAEQFSVMILVDGCALLWYIFLCVCSGGDHEDYNIGYQDLSLIHQDALLLENQLPYQLLFQDLLKMTEPELTIDCWRVIILEFFGMIEESFFQEFFGMEQSFLRKMKNYCCALLVWITQIIKRKSETSDKESKRCHHLLDLYRNYLLGPTPKHTENGNSGNENGRKGHKVRALVGDVKEQVMASFRNVKELMAAGIRIKPSPTHHLRDISFTSNCVTACLRLPPITLIRAAVRGVLQNNLGTHEEVAEFFNTVSADLESNFLAYKDVRVKIRNHLKSHYNSRLKMWMTQCLDTYFGSPWTIIAWVGAALALFFTAVQTYFSVFLIDACMPVFSLSIECFCILPSPNSWPPYNPLMVAK